MDLGQNNSAGVVIAALGVSRGMFWAVLFGKTMISDWLSYFEQKWSRLCQKLTAGCPKLQSTSPEKVFETKKMKNYDFSVILYFERKISNFARKRLSMCAKTACCVSSGTFWGNEGCWKKWFLTTFRALSWKFWNVDKNITAGFPKLQTNCPGNFFAKIFLKNSW